MLSLWEDRLVWARMEAFRSRGWAEWRVHVGAVLAGEPALRWQVDWAGLASKPTGAGDAPAHSGRGRCGTAGQLPETWARETGWVLHWGSKAEEWPGWAALEAFGPWPRPCCDRATQGPPAAWGAAPLHPATWLRAWGQQPHGEIGRAVYGFQEGRCRGCWCEQGARQRQAPPARQDVAWAGQAGSGGREWCGETRARHEQRVAKPTPTRRRGPRHASFQLNHQWLPRQRHRTLRHPSPSPVSHLPVGELCVPRDVCARRAGAWGGGRVAVAGRAGSPCARGSGADPAGGRTRGPGSPTQARPRGASPVQRGARELWRPASGGWDGVGRSCARSACPEPCGEPGRVAGGADAAAGARLPPPP